MSAILPLGETLFTDENGVPLALGSVAFYVPNTLTPKDTFQDQGLTILNINPVPLDAAGRALIWGSGSYRQIVKDSLGNTIWDQITAEPAGSGGGAPTGPAGGSLSGTYPDPTIADTAVTPAQYGDSTHFAQFTVAQDGRVTQAAQFAIAATGVTPAQYGNQVAIAQFTVQADGRITQAQEFLLSLPPTVVTIAYTLVLNDQTTGVIGNNAGAFGVTIPPHATVPLPVGVRIPLMQLGAGQNGYILGAGVTSPQGAGPFNCSAQYKIRWAWQIALNSWIFYET